MAQALFSDNADGLCTALRRQGLLVGRDHHALESGFGSESFPIAAALDARIVNFPNDSHSSVSLALRKVECVRDIDV